MWDAGHVGRAHVPPSHPELSGHVLFVQPVC